MKGARRIGGRDYMMANRGTKAECEARAAVLRKEWRYVVVKGFAFGPLAALLDDYAVYIHPVPRTKETP